MNKIDVSKPIKSNIIKVEMLAMRHKAQIDVPGKQLQLANVINLASDDLEIGNKLSAVQHHVCLS